LPEDSRFVPGILSRNKEHQKLLPAMQLPSSEHEAWQLLTQLLTQHLFKIIFLMCFSAAYTDYFLKERKRHFL